MNNGDPYIGRRFGNYRTVAKLRCGSFACVYLAEHVYLERIAAIKLLRSIHLNSPRERARFLQEARLLEMLKYPYILPLYDFGIDENEHLPYLVTEYASNGSLRDLLRRYAPRPLPMKRAVTILSEVGLGLYHAHQNQIIHRDLKPGNILFNAQGEVLVADFNIATQDGFNTAPAGTPPYMPPEQFRGTVNAKSDQYALGCIAYELFTGRRPFVARDLATLRYMHTHENPIPPTWFNPNLPLPVEEVIFRAMQKRRINRYTDVLEFVTALQDASLS